MATTNKAKSLQLVLAHEGGYVNHPKDPGGATNKGITQRVYDAYRTNQAFDTRSVREIEDFEVEQIYHWQYWAVVKADILPAGFDYAVFDYSVNSGTSRAIKDLQRALNANANFYGISGQLVVDGVCGQSTVAACIAAANTSEQAFIAEYCERRMNFLRSLKTWGDFGKGWQRRVMGVEEGYQANDGGVIDYATRMASDDLAYPIPANELPHTVGTLEGEQAGKGMEAQQSPMKTAKGAGTAITSVGAGGQVLLEAAQQVLPHAGISIFGKLAIAAFALLILVGVALLVYDFIKKQKEQSAT